MRNALAHALTKHYHAVTDIPKIVFGRDVKAKGVDSG